MFHWNRLVKSMVLAWTLVLLFSAVSVMAKCQVLSESVLRVHILANSDAPEDQAVKLLVRDVLLQQSGAWVEPDASFQQALAAACTHLETIEALADRVLQENGKPYTARACVRERWFPQRSYGFGTLPAGKYRTLEVKLGEGAGQNWWCMWFPSLCVSAAAESLPENVADAVENPEAYRVEFLLSSICDSIREFFDGWGGLW